MKNIKVRITPQVRGADILLTMLAAGYKIESPVIQSEIISNVAVWVFGNDSSLIGCLGRDDDDAAPDYYEEHFVVNGQLVTKDYWTQPKTPEQKPVVPIGIRPRASVQQDRMSEIIIAMGRYVEAGAKIPGEWFSELEDLNETVKGE